VAPWAELGIEPTGDAGLIRKAYAARLKRCRPEDDPAGFTRLRAAYEAALALAPRIAARPDAAGANPPPRPERVEARPEPEVAPEPVLPQPPVRIERVVETADRQPDADARAEPGNPVIRIECVADEHDEGPQGKPAVSKPLLRVERVAVGDEEPAQGKPAVSKPLLRVERVAASDEEPAQRKPADSKPLLRVERVAAGDEEPAQGKPADSKPRLRVERSAAGTDTERQGTSRTETPAGQLTGAGIAAVDAVIDALNRRAVEEAVRLLLQATTAHMLPLRVEFGLKERLAALVLDDRSIAVGRLIAIAQLFGWYDAKDFVGRRNGGVESRLCERIDRELAAAKSVPHRVPVKKGNPVGRFFAALILVLTLLGALIAVADKHQVVPNQMVLAPPTTEPHTRLNPPPAPPEPTGSPTSACSLSGNGYSSPEGPERPDGKVDRSFTAARPVRSQTAPPSLRERTEDGSSAAQNELGVAYYNGTNVQRDYALALSWFRRAALQGQTEARRNLAALCRRGLGTARDDIGARQLYYQGAKQGDPSAQASLGEMLIAGQGGPAAPSDGLSWMLIAARTGNMTAMVKLGDFYALGSASTHDLAKSAAWRKAAAAAGDAASMYAYGSMVLDGDGVAADPAEAYRWLALAARAGDPAATAKLAGPSIKLTVQQRAAIDQELKSWHAGPPTPPAIDAHQ
jgi:TPR repeat protein